MALSDITGEKQKVSFAGKEWLIEPLDFSDLAAVEGEICANIYAVEIFSARHQLGIIWAALRRADPSLSPVQALAERYTLTTREVGRMMMRAGDQESIDLYKRILLMSGLVTQQFLDVLDGKSAPEETAPEGDGSKNSPSRSKK